MHASSDRGAEGAIFLPVPVAVAVNEKVNAFPHLCLWLLTCCLLLSGAGMYLQVSFDAEVVKGRHCLMIDDLVDSGLTMQTVQQRLLEAGWDVLLRHVTMQEACCDMFIYRGCWHLYKCWSLQCWCWHNSICNGHMCIATRLQLCHPLLFYAHAKRALLRALSAFDCHRQCRTSGAVVELVLCQRGLCACDSSLEPSLPSVCVGVAVCAQVQPV